MNERKLLLPKIARNVFEEATASSLGSTFHIIVAFHLKQKFGKDPYEILIENPQAFYGGLAEILGAGAEATINLVGTYLSVKYGMSCTTEEFVKLFTKGCKTQRFTLSEILESIINQEKNKLKVQ